MQILKILNLVLSENAYLKQERAYCVPPFDAAEQRQFDGQLNDDYSIEILVYRKNLKSSEAERTKPSINLNLYN